MSVTKQFMQPIDVHAKKKYYGSQLKEIHTGLKQLDVEQMMDDTIYIFNWTILIKQGYSNSVLSSSALKFDEKSVIHPPSCWSRPEWISIYFKYIIIDN